ncbi:hypothetical protein LJC25_03550 [Bacteroidales bacterium OttesenSCG-928-K03]|nr:hypothetical protein [Bacteroidales bacterium OttesenSCG-928-L14]MDL2240264.1 hypothetical protein [Bacteroidales bacterium OttesenSCG-928-K22]MDL2242786.1 hypothetical protein [Bacteroidales bacterium OttesenSCG-928-K03]
MNNSQNESESIMIMITQQSEIRIMLSGHGSTTISWGDGSHETIVFGQDGGSKDFWGYYMTSHWHTYTDNKPSHTINITGGIIPDLECSNSGLTDLYVSKNKNLKLLSCHTNQLKELDLSNNTRLWDLSCAHNQLTELNVSNNIELSDINCRNNLLTNTALNNLFKGLHSNDVSGRYPYDEDERTIIIDNNIGTENCDRTIAHKKGWRVCD